MAPVKVGISQSSFVVTIMTEQKSSTSAAAAAAATAAAEGRNVQKVRFVFEKKSLRPVLTGSQSSDSSIVEQKDQIMFKLGVTTS